MVRHDGDSAAANLKVEADEVGGFDSAESYDVLARVLRSFFWTQAQLSF